jgi:flagellar operon protein
MNEGAEPMSISSGVKIDNFRRPVNLVEIAGRGKAGAKAGKVGGDSFEQMFSRELAGTRNVSFSKHAAARLFSRGIELADTELTRIADAIDKAEAKGSRETLVLSDDYALLVSIRNRTVVTAFGRESLREGVVTSIDSAVIL